MPHIFAGNPFDRAEAERRDQAWLDGAPLRPEARVLLLHKLNILVNRPAASSVHGTPQAQLGWIGPEIIGRLPADAPPPVLLGLRDGVPHFAQDVSAIADPATLGLPLAHTFVEARAAAAEVSSVETGIIAQAKAQVDWHSRHSFCHVCGGKTAMSRGGLQRDCPSCKAQHFPRTDPVVIMLVHSGDRCILGQTRARMSSGFYSCLAGFMDQGEAIEEAVQREVREEAGLELRSVRYHSSQPWPFPSSLMIGCHAAAATTEIHYDPEEMADVRWFTREEVALALQGRHSAINIPGPIAIAHHLIKAWATGEVS